MCREREREKETEAPVLLNPQLLRGRLTLLLLLPVLQTGSNFRIQNSSNGALQIGANALLPPLFISRFRLLSHSLKMGKESSFPTFL